MFFFSSRRRHTIYWRDWSSDVCSSDLATEQVGGLALALVPPLGADQHDSRHSGDFSSVIGGTGDNRRTDGRVTAWHESSWTSAAWGPPRLHAPTGSRRWRARTPCSCAAPSPRSPVC